MENTNFSTGNTRLRETCRQLTVACVSTCFQQDHNFLMGTRLSITSVRTHLQPSHGSSDDMHARTRQPAWNFRKFQQSFITRIYVFPVYTLKLTGTADTKVP